MLTAAVTTVTGGDLSSSPRNALGSEKLVTIRSLVCLSAVPIGLLVLLLRRFQQGVSMDDAELVSPERTPRVFPHTTLLPGLQFSLAGIVGKPDTFYSVPAIRFAYEVLSYM